MRPTLLVAVSLLASSTAVALEPPRATFASILDAPELQQERPRVPVVPGAGDTRPARDGSGTPVASAAHVSAPAAEDPGALDQDSPRVPVTSTIRAPNAQEPSGPPAASVTKDLGPAPGLDVLNGRFEFGSYGRLGDGSDLRGQLGRTANVVSHGARLVEGGYAELELRREDSFGAVKSRVVSTVAFFAPFFHFSGSADQHIALRNLYAEAKVDGFSAWVGSRMFRGDDIYLLDFWPLDNLNTVGGGARYDFGEGTNVQLHAGMQRLDEPTQHQVVASENPLGYGAVSVTRLDRPRIIESLKVQHERRAGGFGVRGSLYGEAHELSAGVRRDQATGDESVLPSDLGLLVGGQLSVWAPGNRYAHLWVRQAAGLGVYDELTTPTTFANDRTTRGARSTRLAFSAGWDTPRFGVLAGGYLDLVRDAGVSSASAQKYDEGALVTRAQWYAAKHFGLAAEASYQRRVYSLVDPGTGALRAGSVAQLGVMPYFSPLGPGLFNRPQLRLVYALTLRDAGAQRFYAAGDVASHRGVEHYLGLGVEWWFNATTYPVR
ncbi:MAG: carbohydrate porin [Myxococcaceae bacterium]